MCEFSRLLDVNLTINLFIQIKFVKTNKSNTKINIKDVTMFTLSEKNMYNNVQNS